MCSLVIVDALAPDSLEGEFNEGITLFMIFLLIVCIFFRPHVSPISVIILSV